MPDLLEVDRGHLPRRGRECPLYAPGVYEALHGSGLPTNEGGGVTIPLDFSHAMVYTMNMKNEANKETKMTSAKVGTYDWTIPTLYSNQDFDEKQSRAQQLTDADRAAGRPAPKYGYSAENFERAEAERKAAIKETTCRR